MLCIGVLRIYSIGMTLPLASISCSDTPRTMVLSLSKVWVMCCSLVRFSSFFWLCSNVALAGLHNQAGNDLVRTQGRVLLRATNALNVPQAGLAELHWVRRYGWHGWPSFQTSATPERAGLPMQYFCMKVEKLYKLVKSMFSGHGALKAKKSCTFWILFLSYTVNNPDRHDRDSVVVRLDVRRNCSWTYWEGRKCGIQQSVCCDGCIDQSTYSGSRREDKYVDHLGFARTGGPYRFTSYNCPPQTGQNDLSKNQEMQDGYFLMLTCAEATPMWVFSRSLRFVHYSEHDRMWMRGGIEKAKVKIPQARVSWNVVTCFTVAWLEMRAPAEISQLWLMRRAELEDAAVF